jgi:hypothetical protein
MWQFATRWRKNSESLTISCPMENTSAKHQTVVEFPLFNGECSHFAKLDGYIMSDLAPLIGFEGGAYALHRAGYKFIGDLAGSLAAEIAKVRGIGPKKLAMIDGYLRELGLDFGQDVGRWREYRKRFDEAQPHRPLSGSDGRRRRLRVVASDGVLRDGPS